ncbi:MAG: serpin family protein [Lachnospiraceae bacterium]|nr:serpin family protein [Lachnospiraceae bacterium]
MKKKSQKMLLHSLISLILAGAMILSLTACSSGSSVKAGELTASYKRQATDPGEVTPAFTEAFRQFSFRLFNETAKDASEKNLLISPFSAYVCLALAANGAGGETKAELEQLLGLSADELNPAIYAYTKDITESPYIKAKVDLANSVWIRDNSSLNVKTDFLQTLADWYGAQAYRAPFSDDTVSEINKWCKEHTNGMIEKIMDPPIAPDEMMYLINALVFEGKWETQYDENKVKTETFRNGDGNNQTASMLLSEEDIYLSSDDCKGFLKPYEGTRICFAALLPEDEDIDIRDFAASLTQDKWTDLWYSREAVTVDVKIPEFTVRDKNSLVPSLKRLNTVKMFGMEADFLPMADYAGDSLYVSDVNQHTYLELNREGTKAAAVTGMTFKQKSIASDPFCKVYLDRPFVYMILDMETGLPLFMGTVREL